MDLIESLKQHEGIALKPYKCTAGKITLGCGRNLDDNGISHEEAMFMLQNDIEKCIKELDRMQGRGSQVGGVEWGGVGWLGGWVGIAV